MFFLTLLGLLPVSFPGVYVPASGQFPREMCIRATHRFVALRVMIASVGLLKGRYTGGD